ncbi:hypothetical protein DFH08DRAFT_969035 [Mycena albidolilacea]|uniref:Uncharacterized protein n=1 Tax=Mycena albidolilacea TaxID=1033008 RepID=A0AAD7EHR7_9AGAR|nr:hypothetical protein DFH08DRAFT_969035 [Mycena albidolilacea]
MPTFECVSVWNDLAPHRESVGSGRIRRELRTSSRCASSSSHVGDRCGLWLVTNALAAEGSHGNDGSDKEAYGSRGDTEQRYEDNPSTNRWWQSKRIAEAVQRSTHHQTAGVIRQTQPSPLLGLRRLALTCFWAHVRLSAFFLGAPIQSSTSLSLTFASSLPVYASVNFALAMNRVVMHAADDTLVASLLQLSIALRSMVPGEPVALAGNAVRRYARQTLKGGEIIAMLED